jgi:hypothetical protein
VSAPVDILAALTAYNAQAVIEQGRVQLVCRDPLPAELIETARAHKDQLRALLEARRDRPEERAAILEFDERLPRAEAEAIVLQELSGDEREQAQHEASPYLSALAALRAKCPAYVPEDCWHQAVADAAAFTIKWGAEALAFGWTEHELYGLHPVPEQPAPNYSRLSRLDDMGLLWLLRGRPVVALTATEAAYRCPSGATLTCRREHTLTPGPLGDRRENTSGTRP